MTPLVLPLGHGPQSQNVLAPFLDEKRNRLGWETDRCRLVIGVVYGPDGIGAFGQGIECCGVREQAVVESRCAGKNSTGRLLDDDSSNACSFRVIDGVRDDAAFVRKPPIRNIRPGHFCAKQWSALIIFFGIALAMPARTAAQSSENDDDLIEVTIGTVTAKMTREQALRSQGLRPKTTAQQELDRLVASGELGRTPKPFPKGAVKLESKEVFHLATGETYARDQLRAKLDAAILDLNAKEDWKREIAAYTFLNVWHFAKVRYEPSIEPLKRALNDPAASVRRASAEALGVLGEIDSSRSTLLGANEYKFLADIGDRKSLPTIKRALANGSRQQRIAALFALIKFGEPKSELMPVIKAGLRDPDELNREPFIDALGDIDDPEALAILRKLSADQDENMRAAARRVLRRKGLIENDDE